MTNQRDEVWKNEVFKHKPVYTLRQRKIERRKKGKRNENSKALFFIFDVNKLKELSSFNKKKKNYMQMNKQ
jgi:hypothetical protein